MKNPRRVQSMETEVGCPESLWCREWWMAFISSPPLHWPLFVSCRWVARFLASALAG